MKKAFVVLSLILFHLSCAEEQDLGQFDDLSIEPIVASSIFYFESDENTINAIGIANFYEQLFTFEAFSDPNVADKILDGVITYQIENTTSKSLGLEIEFLDANGNTLDTESFTIEADPSPLLERQIAYGEGGRNLDILRNSTNIRVSGENFGNAISLSAQNEPKVILRSSAAFRLKLR